MPAVQHARGTRAALDALAATNGLVPWQIYVLADQSRIAVATSASTYTAFLKEGEGGSNTTYSEFLTVLPAVMGETTVVVTNAAAAISSVVNCWLVPNADWEIDDLQDLRILGVSGAGQVTFSIQREGPIGGELRVAYTLG